MLIAIRRRHASPKMSQTTVPEEVEVFLHDHIES